MMSCSYTVKKKVSDILTGDGKIGNLFLQRIFIIMLYHAHVHML
jgi:hypothetical protein